MKMRYKLLIVGAFPPPGSKIYGGQVRACQFLLQSSLSKRFSISTIDSTQASNPPPGFFIRLLYAGRRMLLLLRQLFKTNPDAVLLFLAVGPSVVEKGLMTVICRVCGVPVLVFPRGGELIDHVERYPLMRFVTRIGIGSASCFLCQGHLFQKFALNKLGFKDTYAPIVPNWTATEQHLNIGRRRLKQSSVCCPRLLFVGWMEHFKGIFELLEASRLLSQEGLKFHLTLAGDGHATPDARKFVMNNRMDRMVSFAGWVKDKELDDLLASHDVFVLPSWAEGFPNAMVEGLAAGLAVIVSSVGMIPDYLQDGFNALLVPPRQIEPLADALREVIKRPELRTKLSNKGHRLAEKTFSLEPAMQKLGDIIEAVICDDKK